MHLFLHYLLNDSQTICSTIHFSKPLMICADWSISFKAERSATVYSVTVETDIFNVAKHDLAYFSIQTNAKVNGWFYAANMQSCKCEPVYMKLICKKR